MWAFAMSICVSMHMSVHDHEKSHGIVLSFHDSMSFYVWRLRHEGYHMHDQHADLQYMAGDCCDILYIVHVTLYCVPGMRSLHMVWMAELTRCPIHSCTSGCIRGSISSWSRTKGVVDLVTCTVSECTQGVFAPAYEQWWRKLVECAPV